MKKSGFVLATFAMASVLSVSSSADAGITIVRTNAPAPTYANTLNFDEVGGPTGNNIATNSFASIGISSVVGQDDGFASVVNASDLFAWGPDSKVLYSPWGLEITFAQPVSSLSFQGWGNGGNPTMMGGGTFINLFSGASPNPVGGAGYNAAWGGVGDTWYNITTTAGSTFDKITFHANTFGFPEQFMDNMSWNTAVVPAPGAFALLGLAGLIGAGRRRRA